MREHSKTEGTTLLAAALAALSLLAFAATASAAEVPQPSGQFPAEGEAVRGPGANQFDEPRAIAASPDGSRVYVSDGANNRIDVYGAWGQFREAFGWGVRDGAAEQQNCLNSNYPEAPPHSDCKAGIAGSGAGQFGDPEGFLGAEGIAVNGGGDLWVADPENARVQKLSPTGQFKLMAGGDVIADGATATGILTPGSATVTAVTTTSKLFTVGQPIEGTGIEAGTRIAALGPGTITLSTPAGPAASGAPTAISSPEGPNNVPSNETQTIELGENLTGGKFGLIFTTPDPSPSSAYTGAKGEGKISGGSTLVTEVTTSSGTFEAGDPISGGNIPGGTTITAVGAGTLTLSQPVAGPATFTTPLTTYNLSPGAGAAEIQAALLALPNVDPGEVEVTGPAGGPWTVEFKGPRLADAAFLWLTVQAAGLTYKPGTVNSPGATLAKGGEVCHAAAECQAGTAGTAVAQFQWAPGAFVAVGAGDTLYVGDRNRIQVFEDDGAFKEQITFAALHASFPAFPESGYVRALVYDAKSGDLYLTVSKTTSSQFFPYVYKLTPAGTVAGTLEVHQPAAIATEGPEGEGNVFVVEPSFPNDSPYGDEEHPEQEVHEFDAAGNPVGVVARSKAPPYISLGTNRAQQLYLGQKSDSEAFVSIFGPPPLSIEDPLPLPPNIRDQYAAQVDPEGALIKGTIDPRYWNDTTYYLEYGTSPCSTGGCASTYPNPPGSLLTTKQVTGGLSAAVHLTGLTPATAYHYRLVSQSGGSSGQPVRGVGGTLGTPGTEGAFITPPLPPAPPNPDPCPNAAYRIGPGALLPDCRAYEMVSPLEKGNSDVVTLIAGSVGYKARLDQAATSGDAFSFSAARAFPGSVSGGWATQYLSRRGAEGWSNESISPAQSGDNLPGFFVNNTLDTNVRAFSPDLETAWFTLQRNPNPDPSFPGGFVDVFRRDSASGSFEAQVRTTPPHPHYPELQGVSADGRHAVFRVEDNLTPDAPVIPEDPQNLRPQLYESYRKGAGPAQLRLVSILPGGEAAETGASAGIAGNGIILGAGRVDTLTHAISEDGSRIYWTAANVGPGHLYVRVSGTETKPVSEASGGNTGAARFLTASADGSTALFTYTSGPAQGDLYRYTIAGKGKATLVAHKALGYLAGSEDLQRYYFAAEEAIAGASPNSLGESPSEGVANLYLAEGKSFAYVGRLSSEDANGAAKVNHLTAVNPAPYFHGSAASPDGHSLAFMSNSPQLAQAVAGYDNTDQKSGALDSEVYLYREGQLRCASCNPSGQRPVGDQLLNSKGSNRITAASFLAQPDTQLSHPRYLSADGTRLFFSSFESLVARDTNGAMDVYEWEAPGAGPAQSPCSEASSSFSPRNGGCIYLISSGQSPRESEFLDASPDGRDVFFTTLSSLVGTDPNLVDVYDARIEGGFPEPPPPAATCEGEACQGAYVPPEDRTPASAAFKGAGNVHEEAATAGRCPKGRKAIKRKGKARCVKPRPKKKAQKQRANAEQGRNHR
jgi:hypothetical protein